MATPSWSASSAEHAPVVGGRAVARRAPATASRRRRRARASIVRRRAGRDVAALGRRPPRRFAVARARRAGHRSSPNVRRHAVERARRRARGRPRASPADRARASASARARSRLERLRGDPVDERADDRPRPRRTRPSAIDVLGLVDRERVAGCDEEPVDEQRRGDARRRRPPAARRARRRRSRAPGRAAVPSTARSLVEQRATRAVSSTAARATASTHAADRRSVDDRGAGGARRRGGGSPVRAPSSAIDVHVDVRARAGSTAADERAVHAARAIGSTAVAPITIWVACSRAGELRPARRRGRRRRPRGTPAERLDAARAARRAPSPSAGEPAVVGRRRARRSARRRPARRSVRRAGSARRRPGAPVMPTTTRSRVSQASAMPCSVEVVGEALLHPVGDPQQRQLAQRAEVAGPEVVRRARRRSRSGG